MKLLGSLASPFVRKVRDVLAEKKIDCPLELVDAWSPESALQQSNPLGKVPCLIMDDGGAMFDSRVIVEYLDSISPLHKLIPAGGRASAEVKCWEALCDGLLDAGVLIRVESTQRPESLRSAAWVARQQGKIDAAVAAIARGLGERQWACEGRYTLADVCIGCAFGWLSFRFPAHPWRDDHPALAAYVDRLMQRPSFIETMPQ